MKIHLTWIRVTATAAIVAGASAQPADAQYAPYRPIAKQPVAPAQQPIAQPTTQFAPAANTQTPYVAWQQAQGVAPYRPATTQVQAQPQYPQTAAPYVPSVPYAPAAVQAVSPYPTGYPSYPQMARRSNDNSAGPAEVETMPAPQNAHSENGTNGYLPSNGHGTNGEYHNGYPAGYPAAGCATGNCGSNGYYAAPTGQNCGTGYVDYGVSQYFDNPCYDSQWFGGVYFLYMNRDDSSPAKLTVEVDHSVAPDPYYPPADRTVVSTFDADYGYREGVEVRFGSTFTIGDNCNTCDTGCYTGCNTCPAPPSVFAWEVAWWGLDDDADVYTFTDDVDAAPRRIYGMKNFVGLEYDRDGAAGGTWAYRPVNEYYGYGLPIPDPGAGPYADGYLAVLAQRVRTNFKAQNLEFNIIRFPVCDFACGGCNTGCNNGCDSGCYGDACGCEQSCGPTSAFSMYGSCGVRYFRIDDDFMYANEFTEWSGGAPGKSSYDGFYDGDSDELYYDVQVDNHLIGPQLGWTMNYCVACKWNFFCNSTFGVFNNHIEHMQQMWSGGGGDVRFVGSGEDFYVESDKNDISFLGELRLGGSYDVTCNWRAVAAYRAIAVTGIANSTDQIPTDFTNREYVEIIDSDSSIIVHGVQVGAECRY